jgi:hypothetical protein
VLLDRPLHDPPRRRMMIEIVQVPTRKIDERPPPERYATIAPGERRMKMPLPPCGDYLFKLLV